MNVLGYSPKAGLKPVLVVDDTGDRWSYYPFNQPGNWDEGPHHHLLCLMQCHMNSVLIAKLPKFLAPFPSETTHALQLEKPFNATHPIIIPLKVNEVTSYFKVRMPTWEKYEDQNIPKIELTAEALPWEISSPKFSVVSPDTPARRQLFINYDTAGVIDDDNYATVLKSFVSTLSWQTVQVNTNKVSGIDNMVLSKKWGILSKKALNTICCTTQHGVCTVLHPFLSRWNKK